MRHRVRSIEFIPLVIPAETSIKALKDRHLSSHALQPAVIFDYLFLLFTLSALVNKNGWSFLLTIWLILPPVGFLFEFLVRLSER
jgi:hypothetical protein